MRIPVLLAVIVSLSTPAGAEIGPGYFASANVEFVRHVPGSYDSPGGRIVGDRFYVTTSRDIQIYDISAPDDPRLLGSLLLLQDPQFAEEDLDTNGRIALVGAEGTLNVIDVSDPTKPAVIGRLPGADAHTISCVLDCTYAYASNGLIVDLRDPRAPVLAGRWNTGTVVGDAHDVTEVAPGLVVTSSQPVLYLDARTDPLHPAILRSGSNADGRYIHGNVWPRAGTDRFLLTGGETSGPLCSGQRAGAFMVWDAATFTMLDERRVSSGVPTDGNMLAAQYCAHWFTPHPSFADGGPVAMAWYDYGVRFLNVARDGRITETGWFIAAGSAASAAHWATDEIVYVLDYNRGFDVIRYTR